MKHIKWGWKLWVMPLLVGMMIFIFGGVSSVQAEPPIHLSPGELLMDLLGSTVGSSSSYAPIKLLADCSAEFSACWDTHGLNKDNEEQVMDACWKETKACPKVCKDEYFSRRKAGMSSAMADPLFRGRHGEDTSCVPGVDTSTHPMGKVKSNDSAVRISVMVGGQPAKAEVYAVPVDAQGNEGKRTTSSPNYSGGNVYRDVSKPILLNLPAGRYRLHVLSPDRFYHRNRAFPEQVTLFTVETGQTVDKSYIFRMGRLVVNAKDKGGLPVPATVELRRYDRPDYVLLRASLPLDKSLFAGKYRLVVKETKSRKSKALDIEIKAESTVTKVITFATKLAKETSVKDASICFNQVQGKISWSLLASTTRWNPNNIIRLCRGEENSNQPPACFDRVMHKGIKHGNDGTSWTWQDALNLCEGTANASETIRCFENDLQKGLSTKQAIQHCGK